MRLRAALSLALGPLGLGALAVAASSCSAAPGGGEPSAVAAQAVGALAPVASFGSNPGNLLMYAYVPASPAQDAPLVVALHGCGETASDYEAAGWNALADKYGFYVLYPQQQSANNIETCFNWFGNTSGSTADITRGQGEAESIAQMIQTMKGAHSIDSKRVFVNGFSAGAAYAVALLALYPDVFAAGASFSGVPFGCASSLTTAYSCMGGAVTKAPTDWATLVKAGFPGYGGTYPRLSVWQGSGDTTVNTANLGELVAQWTAVTGVGQTPTKTETVAGFPHQVFESPSGVAQVESWSITGMTHAVSLDVSGGCGTASTYFIDEKLCAVDRAAQFFGIEPAQAVSTDGGKGSGSGSGSSSGGGGGSGGGSGSGTGLGSSGAGDDSGASAGSGDAPDAGPAGPTTLPGCSLSGGARPGSPLGWLGALLGAAMLLRRRAR